MSNAVASMEGVSGVGRPEEAVAGAPATGAAAKSRIPCLDGWRAVSICLVLGAHCHFLFNIGQYSFYPHVEWVFGSSLGVKFFFVISGFLITYLMIGEADKHGRISLRRFYLRRALRILPVYFGFILVVYALQRLTPYHQTRAQWMHNLTFTTNFVPTPITTDHLWSLSVEEQFYVFWPVLFVLFFKRARPLIVAVLVLWVIAAPICRCVPADSVWNYEGVLRHNFGNNGHPLLQNLDFLAMGCLTAVALTRYGKLMGRIFGEHAKLLIGLGAGLILGPLILNACQPGEIVLHAIDSSLQAAGFAILMVTSIYFPDYFKPLNWRLVRYVGVLSYSIYIWQQLFCTDPAQFGLASPWWMSFPWWLIPVTITAVVSYHLLEKPLMSLRSKFRV